MTDSSLTELNRWLVQLVERRGSDLLLVTDAPACIRVDGQVVPIGTRKLVSDEIENAITPALMPHALRQYLETRIADSSYRNTNLGRFRINLHQERGRAAATIRALPRVVPFLHELHLPPSVEQLAHLPRGLVLIGGPAGSGKSTTVAALVNEINRRDARHIVTIEDPIEYEHANICSVIEQVEVGHDAPDFPTALRAALRQAPDVLVVGEMRDPETMHIAVTAAETGIWFSPRSTPLTLLPPSRASLTHSHPSARAAFARSWRCQFRLCSRRSCCPASAAADTRLRSCC